MGAISACLPGWKRGCREEGKIYNEGEEGSRVKVFEEVTEELALDMSMDHSPRVRREEKITANAGIWADLSMKESGNSLLAASLFLVS